MKVKIIKEYKDVELHRVPRIGEELLVSDERARSLINGNVAYAVCEDAEAKDAQIAELTEAVKAKDAQIEKLTKALEEAKKSKK